ncbi:MAG TPA: sulfotransferase [Chthoniobacteraceae bacterium]|nr:sulfotransferase [Chthoniobacteraceae bacterium]
MSEGNPIFILSCERSGSSLLRYLIDTHPEICSPGEIATGELAKALMRTVSRTTAWVQPGLETDEARTDFARAETRRLIFEIMDAYARGKGKRYWCDKTPLNLTSLGLLDWVFPEARYLCLYRNSLDVVRSCLAASQNGFMPELAPYAQKNPGNLVAAMIDSWVTKTRWILDFEQKNPRCHRLYYEGLVHAPVATLDGVFGFLGLPWDKELIDRAFTTPHDPGGGDNRIRQTTKIEVSRPNPEPELNPRMLTLVPPELREKQQFLHFELNYPV